MNEEKALLSGDNDPIYARVCDSAIRECTVLDQRPFFSQLKNLSSALTIHLYMVALEMQKE